MVEEKILTPAKDPTDWVSSMVTVVKPNKLLRICIDPKDLKLKKEKVKLRMTEVPYIEHQLTSEGI